MKRLIMGFFITLFMASVSFGLPTQQPTGLTWVAPLTNADGSVYIDQGGFYVYYATASGDFADTRRFQITDPTDINVLFSEITGMDNPAGVYFAVTAYDTSGNESDYSNEVQNVPLIIPVAPGNLQIQ